MDVFNQFYFLFLNMDFSTAILLAVGLICMIVEITQPSIKWLGVMGVVSLIAGAALRLTSLADGERFFGIAFAYIATVAVILLLYFVLSVRVFRYLWVKYLPDVSNESEEETDKKYADLCGVVGVARANLRPIGKAKLAGSEYTVMAEGFFINRGSKIKVVKVERGNIIVRKV